MKRSSGISNGLIQANARKNNIGLFCTKRVSFINNKKAKKMKEKLIVPMETMEIDLINEEDNNVEDTSMHIEDIDKNNEGDDAKYSSSSDNASEKLNSSDSENSLNDENINIVEYSSSEEKKEEEKKETVKTNEKERNIIEVDKSFNIIPLIQAIIETKPKIPIDDGDDLQFPVLFPKKITKGKFARALNNWFIISAVPISNQLELLIVLEEHLSGVKLPIKKTKANNYKSTISNYNIDVSRTLKFDICSRNGCMAFVGEKSKLKECEKCHQKRYRPCTKCQFVFLNSANECNHGISFRKPYKTVFYRPILPLIINLINTDLFLKFLNYEMETLAGHVEYSDVQQGSNFKKNYSQMKDKYDDYCADRSIKYKQNINEIKEEITMVNILLSQFYDGCQVYKKKQQIFGR